MKLRLLSVLCALATATVSACDASPDVEAGPAPDSGRPPPGVDAGRAMDAGTGATDAGGPDASSVSSDAGAASGDAGCPSCTATGATPYWMGAGPRDNGLDLDDDFRVGEPEDSTACDRVGGRDAGGAYAEDIDGDGVTEQQYWIVGAAAPAGLPAGVDSASCGTLASPCRTVAQALANADGPGNGEDIFCVAGTLNERLELTSSGAAGTKTRTPTAGTNEQWDFEYPSNPTMLIGADLDDDGVYPPNDPDDRAVFQDTAADRFAWAITAVNASGSRVEIAHVSFEDFGRYTKESGGVFRQAPGRTVLEHWYVHDFAARRINFDQCHASGTIMFSTFSFRPLYFAAEHASFDRVQGYLTRGGYDGSHVRYRGWRVRHRAMGGGPNENAAGVSCDNPGGRDGNWFRNWATTPGDHFVEWIDNDLQLAEFARGAPSNVAAGILLCSVRKLHIVGNRVLNYQGGLPVVNTNDRICEAHSPQFAGDYLFARNFVGVSDPALLNPSRFVNGTGLLNGMNAAANPLTDGFAGYFRVADNELDLRGYGADNDRLGSFFLMQIGPEVDNRAMRLEIVRNVIAADWHRRPNGPTSWGSLLHQYGAAGAGIPDSVILEDNVLFNPSPDDQNMIRFPAAADVASLTGDGNQYSECRWSLSGASYATLREWTAASGVDSARGSCGAVPLPPLNDWAR